MNEKGKSIVNEEKIIEAMVIDEIDIDDFEGISKVLIRMEEYNETIKRIPKGKIVRLGDIRKYFMKKYHTCFYRVEYDESKLDMKGIVPYWRVLDDRGKIRGVEQYSAERQAEKLEQEGLPVVVTGKYRNLWKVENYKEYLYEL